MGVYDTCMAAPIQMQNFLHASSSNSMQQVTEGGERTSTKTSAPPLKAQNGHLESTRWLCTCISKNSACSVQHWVRAMVNMADQITTPLMRTAAEANHRAMWRGCSGKQEGQAQGLLCESAA